MREIAALAVSIVAVTVLGSRAEVEATSLLRARDVVPRVAERNELIDLASLWSETEALASSDFFFPEINPSATGVIQKLDAYFLQRLNDKNRLVVSLSETILAVNGNITVRQLASRHHITERQIERLFQSRAGATVKEVCKQVRFQSTLKKIEASPTASFAQIAFEMGYYDHAHMLKDVKRYSGLTLSRIAS